MKHAALTLAAVLAVPAFAGCDKGPTTSARERDAGEVEVRRAGTANASVTAAYRLSNGYTLGVVASNNSGSTTTGTAVFYSAGGDVVTAMSVNCISKSGGHAKLSGTVIESSDPLNEGLDAYFEVIDGTPDQAGTVILAEAPYGPTCLAPPGEYDVETIAAGVVLVP